jgi:hypothetical protein
MASFAKLNSENIVEQVVSINNNELLDNGIESEEKGIAFCKSLFGQNTNWKQSSYNTFKNEHKLGGTPFRKNHASVGYTYDEGKNAFIPPKIFNSWILDENTCIWNPPFPIPETYINNLKYTDGTPCPDVYKWNETILNWELDEIPAGIEIANNI